MHALMRLWQLANVQLLTSNYALQEVWRNIDKSEQRLRLGRLAPPMELVAELAPDEQLARSSGLPEKDVPILHAAISGRATHLITADLRHFGSLVGTTIGGVLIELPGNYLREKAKA
jgi:predicted nucleic acid-binding protein